MRNPKDVLMLEIERSKLNREKSLVVLDKSLLVYFAFIFIAVVGLINGYMKLQTFNLVIGMSLVVLVIGLVPYVVTMRNEEKKLEGLIGELRRGGKR